MARIVYPSQPGLQTTALTTQGISQPLSSFPGIGPDFFQDRDYCFQIFSYLINDLPTTP